MRRETRIGIIAILIYQIVGRFISFPDFIAGIILGLGMCMIVFGLLPESAYEKLKGWKKALFRR